jgi:hypothetical protein
VLEPVEHESELTQLNTRFAQLGYSASGVGGRLDQFSGTSSIRTLERVPDAAYYGTHGISVGDCLVLPESIDKLMATYMRADPIVRERCCGGVTG